MSDEKRLERLERAVAAIADYIALEETTGWAHDEKRARVLEVLQELAPGKSVRDAALSSGATTTAPGADMSTSSRTTWAIESDPIPPNQATAYLANPKARQTRLDDEQSPAK